MKASFFTQPGTPLEIREVKKPKPIKDQVLVRLHNAALNHRDLWIQKEQRFAEGIVLGSDGSGVIEDVGEDADTLLIGMEVIINPSLNWGDNPIVQGNSFKILGMPDAGTFSDYVVVSKKQVFEKPEHLSFAEAAAVPLSALTAYRALFSKARLRAKEKVLITGIGGGAALWAFQFAVAYQARVYVTSGSDEKLSKAKELGAVGGFNYKDPEWAKQALKESGGFDIVIDMLIIFKNSNAKMLNKVFLTYGNLKLVTRTESCLDNEIGRSRIFSLQIEVVSNEPDNYKIGEIHIIIWSEKNEYS
jgi:zinc-binding alcohol dehydrogenase/oxidoreductase